MKLRILQLLGKIMNTLYPVGSYYETSNAAFNPNTQLGGEWELSDDYELVAWIFVNNNAVAASKNMTASGLGGTTYYTMSFTKPMKDINYIVTVSGDASGLGCEIFGIYEKTTTQFLFDHANYSGTQVVVPIFQISVFGRLAEPEKYKWHRIA